MDALPDARGFAPAQSLQYEGDVELAKVYV